MRTADANDGSAAGILRFGSGLACSASLGPRSPPRRRHCGVPTHPGGGSRGGSGLPNPGITGLRPLLQPRWHTNTDLVGSFRVRKCRHDFRRTSTPIRPTASRLKTAAVLTLAVYSPQRRRHRIGPGKAGASPRGRSVCAQPKDPRSEVARGSFASPAFSSRTYAKVAGARGIRESFPYSCPGWRRLLITP